MDDLTKTLLDIAVAANSQYLSTSKIKSDVQQGALAMIALDDWIVEEFGMQKFYDPPEDVIREAALAFCEHEDELNDFLDNNITNDCERLRERVVGEIVSFMEMEAFNDESSHRGWWGCREDDRQRHRELRAHSRPHNRGRGNPPSLPPQG